MFRISLDLETPTEKEGEDMRVLALAVLLFALTVVTACDLPSPTGPTTNTVPPEVFVWWGKAQSKLARLGIDGSNIGPERFTWRQSSGPVRCNGTMTGGCYEPDSKTITYQISESYVICHEAGHAILHELKDSRRSCWEHSCLDASPCFAEKP